MAVELGNLFIPAEGGVQQATYTETEEAGKLSEFTFFTTGIGSQISVVNNEASATYPVPSGYKYFG